MSDSAKTILLCGVGGQGTILAADLLARAAIASGDDVKLSEIHGMAQRGGAVTTVVRVGRAVGTMVADIGDADFLISFETTEALRNIAYLKQDGIAIVSDETIKPLTALTGRVPMPRGARKTLSGFGALVTPAELLARQAGSVKSVNVVLLGVLSTFLDYDEDVWLDVIRGRVPERFVDMNLKAFSLGRSFARDRAGQMG